LEFKVKKTALNYTDEQREMDTPKHLLRRSHWWRTKQATEFSCCSREVTSINFNWVKFCKASN